MDVVRKSLLPDESAIYDLYLFEFNLCDDEHN